jgi:hypothetical protein
LITFDEKIVAVWFVLTIPDRQDWLAAVREIEPDAKYELTYRLRYYKDDKAFDSNDKKNWYGGTVTGTRNYIILSMRKVADMLASVSKAKVYEVVNDKGLDQFLRDFQDQPYAFARMVVAGGADA